MGRSKASSTKSLSGSWAVVGRNPDGTEFIVKCPDEAHAKSVAKELKGKVRRLKK